MKQVHASAGFFLHHHILLSGAAVHRMIVTAAALLITAAVFAPCEAAGAESPSNNIGIHGGVGTDINLGLGYGVKVSGLPFSTVNPIELAGELFISHTVEESTENGYDYTDTTDLVVIGFLANYLGGYDRSRRGLFYVAGVGIAALSVEWEETSPNDSSLGEPYGASGSKMSADGTSAGTVLNLGFGYNFGNNLEMRFELPVIFIFSAPGSAAAIVPTATFMAGWRF